MLKGLKEFLESLAAGPAQPQVPALTVQLATAVLLVEIMRADAGRDELERGKIEATLQRRFALEAAELQQLLQAAEARSRQANDFFSFTSLLNERLDQPQKIAVVEYMWEVAYADGAVDAGELHVISKVAGLLHVTHGEYIAAKLRVKEAMGGAAAGS